MFHQVIERNGQLMAVYSKSDLEYMQRRGWRPHVPQVAALLKAPEPAPQKRKYTRKAKA